ncbi:MAG: hypothetical protein ABMB14_36570 [Myxococcota bacterium]
MWLLALACSPAPTGTVRPTPAPVAAPAPTPDPEAPASGTVGMVGSGTVGLIRRIPGEGTPQLLFPSVRASSPSDPVPPLLAPMGIPGDDGPIEVTGLGWTLRCDDDAGPSWVLAAPVPERLAPVQAPADERGGIASLVVVGGVMPGGLPPVPDGSVARLTVAGIGRIDEDLEGTRTCASEFDQATTLVTAAGSFPVGCCGP